MADTVSRILADLEAGRITAEEAHRLIAGDEGAGGPAAADPVAREPATSKTFEFDFARRRQAVDLGGVGRAVADAVRGAAESVRPGTPLSPTQQEALEGLRAALQTGQIAVLWTADGLGRTTILRALHRETGGAFLSMRTFVDAMQERHPLQLEEALHRMLLDAVAANRVVILDDLHLLTGWMCCNYAYARQNYVEAIMASVCAAVVDTGKKFVVGVDRSAPEPVHKRAYSFGFDELSVEDYQFLIGRWLGPGSRGVDVARVHRFAPNLNAHQIRSACVWLRGEPDVDTERFVEYLRSQRMASNVDLDEVEAVDLRDLKGVEDVIEALEAAIVTPLENDALAAELGIRPKRGVLLAGPPGTGKTTIGRALAHRLKSKFFLIDGTFISGTQGFYSRVNRVFEAARQNAPSVIFIDDSDVIFQSGEEMGLYRYLLTMLDGLESRTARGVCLMMTAMDVSSLPPALVRSGRIELWLETRLPDAEARRAILTQHLAAIPPAMGTVDVDVLVDAAEGLTGADLKRLVEDGKLLYAHDRVSNRAVRPATEYFAQAAESVRTARERYAEAEARANQGRPQRPPWFAEYAMFMPDEE